MKNNNDVVKYDIYELDLTKLRQKISDLGIESCAVYGIGDNANRTFMALKNMCVDIKYYIDVKADGKNLRFHSKKVVSPTALKNHYDGEYIVVTPSIHQDILEWLLDVGVPNEKIIVSFYQTESISINYGSQSASIAPDIECCKERREKPAATFMTIAYNTPEYMFRRAIESVLRQTYQNFVYVIIVNGATDNTLHIAREYACADARISIVSLDKNYSWTDPTILNAIADNLYGKFWCQLDSDDYYDERFLELSFALAAENNADTVCVRTCLFASDKNYNPIKDGLLYDLHDKFYFNVVHPQCHIIGREHIITAYAKSKICSVFWGKLYSSSLLRKYLNDILGISIEERELYFRLDIAMTYKILSMSERIFYSDKVLHFSQYSKRNSTFSLAPIEWLMSLWYAYTNIKREMYFYHKERIAKKYSKAFLGTHLSWIIARKGMLRNVSASPFRAEIIKNLADMCNDGIFTSFILTKANYMRDGYRAFLAEIEQIVKEAREDL